MAEEYTIYSGRKANGDLVLIGVAADPEYAVEDYFVPGLTDITMAGVIQIMGDTHVLPEMIDLSGI